MRRYKVEEIEGIGLAMAGRLRQAGVKTLDDLLESGCHPQGRAALAAATGITESTILKWVNMADLFRVRGIGSEYSELLEKAGVDTVKELRTRNPENLHARIVEANATGRGLVRQVPGVKRVRSWTEAAKRMAPKVTY